MIYMNGAVTSPFGCPPTLAICNQGSIACVIHVYPYVFIYIITLSAAAILATCAYLKT